MLRSRGVELAWFLAALASLAAMVRYETWETVPFHVIWVSLTLVYGFRIWRPWPTAATLAVVAVSTATLIGIDVSHGSQQWGELVEVPLMAAMFVAMVWHARRRQHALQALQVLAESRATLLAQQERFLHDASHELRTPVTIARGHLELLADSTGNAAIALDELARIERIVERLLLLAKADQPDFLVRCPLDLEPFLEDVFMRWSHVAIRSWQLGELAHGTLPVDPEQLRIALDALLENAVKYTEEGAEIRLSAHVDGDVAAIEVTDAGDGVPPEALDRIFEPFARPDPARSRSDGGVGLGLAIVDAIVKAHGGHCTVRADADGSTFSLRLPGFLAAAASPVGSSTAVAPAMH